MFRSLSYSYAPLSIGSGPGAEAAEEERTDADFWRELRRRRKKREEVEKTKQHDNTIDTNHTHYDTQWLSVCELSIRVR